MLRKNITPEWTKAEKNESVAEQPLAGLVIL